jgi:hypothetical protein
MIARRRCVLALCAIVSQRVSLELTRTAIAEDGVGAPTKVVFPPPPTEPKQLAAEKKLVPCGAEDTRSLSSSDYLAANIPGAEKVILKGEPLIQYGQAGSRVDVHRDRTGPTL